MIRITVEMIPGGAARLRRTIAAMDIANLSDLADVSDYQVRISEDDNWLAGTGMRWRTVFVRGHDRRQSVWRLVAAALRALDAAGWD